MQQFTIGCDPEVFVKNSATGASVAATGLVPGDKEAPHKVKGGAIQVDGLALEFNIDPVPSTDFEAFNSNIVSVMGQMNGVLKANGAELGFDITPSVQFDKEYYDGLPENAKELGCDPDFCAYSADPFEPNVRPDGDSGLRSAAGHIHIGWGDGIPVDNADHVEICRSFVKNLDCYVGLGMTVIDADARRRSLYGKAGAFRPKPYGVEYRTPSNVWLRSKAHRRFIHGLVTNAISDMCQNADRAAYRRIANDYGYDVVSIINGGDAKAAARILRDILYKNVPTALVPEGVTI